MRKVLDRLFSKVGLRLVKSHHLEMIYQHDYQGGYSEYKETQIHHNKRKIDHVWADELTLTRICEDVAARELGASGICHGARNGFEVEFLSKHLKGEILGTDISETATDYPNMVVWDFHEENPEWDGKFDFVYSNSLDQAMAPDRALASWAKQIKPDGRIYIEHSMSHSASGAGAMDPFGAHPFAMPYLFFKWGKGKYALDDIIEIESKQNNEQRAWIFVLKGAA